MSYGRKSDFGTIIQIGDILVSEEVVTEFFACDYPVCKGICCVIGDSGAPLEEEELDDLEREYTPVVDGTGECAFTTFGEDGSCFCSIEKCFFSGTCSFRKPRSCWLYPIRVEKLSNGGQALNLHRWNLCDDAFKKGKREGIRVYEFLRDPLISIYGKDFYEALQAAAKVING